MSYNTPSMDDIINDLRKRIADLERAAYVFGDTNNTNNDPLTITGLTPTITYYNQPITGIPLAQVTWTWTAPAAPSADDLTADPVVDYMLSVTSASSPQIEPYASTKGALTTTVKDLPLGTVETARVYAITKKGLKGPIAQATASVTSDTTPPPQPSTPAVAAALKGVVVTWNGLDSSSLAMPVDFAYVEVHASTTGGLTFTPTSATLVDRIYSGRGSTFVTANSNYDPINIRLIAVDTSKNASTASTGAAATPVRAVSSDLGVVLPGDIAYSDIDNLIVDGSFENATIRTNRTNAFGHSGSWTFDNTAGVAASGTWSMKSTNTTGTNAWYLQAETYSQYQLDGIVAVPGSKLYMAFRTKGISANGTLQFGLRFTSQTGVATFATISTTTSTGSWVLVEGVVAVPSDCATIAAYVQVISQTTGTWYVDAVQLRKVTPTMLIEDAAITNAKIGLLAVNDANIADLNAGKLWANTVGSEKFRAGTVSFNRVNDPSFEEDYEVNTTSLTTSPNIDQWAVYSGTGTATKYSAGLSRSGIRACSITSTSGVYVRSNIFQVTPGQTYKLNLNMVGITNDTPWVYIRIACGSTVALSEYPATGAPTGSAGGALRPDYDPVDGTTPTCTRALRVLRNITNKSLTTNVATLTTDHLHNLSVGDTVTITGVDATFDGVYDITAVGSTTTFSYSRTAADVASIAATGTVARDHGTDKLTSFEGVQVPIAYDPSNVSPDDYTTYTASYTIPAGMNYLSIMTRPGNGAASSTIALDDVAWLLNGEPAAELTAAGLRLFDTDGNEVGAFVSNRPNYFSISNGTATLAAIDQFGGISGQSLDIAGVDTDGDGIADSGLTIYGQEFLDYLSALPRGVVAYGIRNTRLASYTTTEAPFQELQAVLEPGRSYRVMTSSLSVQNNTSGGTCITRLRYTTDGTTPGITSTLAAQSDLIYCPAAASWFASPGLSRQISVTTETDFRALLTIAPGNATAANLIGNNGTGGMSMWIEDMGPLQDDTGIDRTGGTPPATKKTYVTTWTSTSSATYQGGGAKRTDTSDVVQGYNSYNGNGKGIWIFPSMTTTLSGATINKVEVYAYANHWYYNSGGTARIYLHGYTSAPASSPSVTYSTQSTGWPVAAGRWVTLPSSTYASFLSGAWRGFGMGPAPSNSLTYYGRFNGGAGAKIRVTYTK